MLHSMILFLCVCDYQYWKQGKPAIFHVSCGGILSIHGPHPLRLAADSVQIRSIHNLSLSPYSGLLNLMILKGINFRQQKTHQPWTKTAGLMGSTNWGHQRKAVALIKTDALRKSSAHYAKNFLFRATSVLSESWPHHNNDCPCQR